MTLVYANLLHFPNKRLVDVTGARLELIGFTSEAFTQISIFRIVLVHTLPLSVSTDA